MKTRAGTSLIEMMTGLIVIALISAACAGLVRSQSRLLRHTSEHAAARETLRAATGIMRAELQDLIIDDRMALSADSVAIRAFRGIGIVCASNPPRVTLRYVGLRQPDPAKDSLLVVGDTRAATMRHVGGATSPCVSRSNELLVAIEPDGLLAIGALVLIWETGSYHLSSNALRYRRGTSGLQPMTDDMIDHKQSRFALSPGRRSVDLDLLAQAAGYSVRGRSRVPFRNP